MPPERVGREIGPDKTVIEAVSADAREGGGLEPSESGGQDLGVLKDGNWCEYLLLVKQAGVYAVTVQTGSNSDRGRIELSLSDTALGTVSAPNTGGYQRWGSTEAVRVALQPGQLVLRMVMARAAMNVKSITFEREVDLPGPASAR
jgi:hypothetical protein